MEDKESLRITDIERRIFSAIESERRAQDAKWGLEPFHTGTPHKFLVLIGEEIGEACKAVNDGNTCGVGKDTYHDELVQVAALCVKALVAMEFQRRDG
jgi:NTP pyrophosphatase (non-canonical NTP hydrolase)